MVFISHAYRWVQEHRDVSWVAVLRYGGAEITCYIHIATILKLNSFPTPKHIWPQGSLKGPWACEGKLLAKAIFESIRTLKHTEMVHVWHQA